MCLTLPRPNRTARSQGMNWCSQHKRLAIYLRDGLACVYCGGGITTGVSLSLDHLVPYSLGGTNEPTNLLTCCKRCNSARGNRPMETFAAVTAAYLGVATACIVSHVTDCLQRDIDTKTARLLVARQGSCLNVLQQLHN